jgi:hypothetical protein
MGCMHIVHTQYFYCHNNLKKQFINQLFDRACVVCILVYSEEGLSSELGS